MMMKNLKKRLAERLEAIANPLGKTINFDNPRSLLPKVQSSEEKTFEIKATEIKKHNHSSGLSHFKFVHFGCGTNLIPGYLNIDIADLSDTSVYLPINCKRDDHKLDYLRHDMRNGIPLDLHNLQGIYSCHFLEHLTKDDGMNFLKQSFDRLEPGGCFRVVVPDFEMWAKAYVNKDQRFLMWYQRNYLNKWDSVVTECTIFNGMIYNYGHACMYDFQTMRDKLYKIGFARVTRKRWSSGSLINMKALETSLNYHQYESLIIECFKP